METGFKTYHPIVNFSYYLVVIIFSMFSMHPIFLAISLMASFSYIIVLEGKSAFKSNFRLLLIIILLSATVNGLFVHKGVTVLFYLNDNAITLESIIYGMAAGTMMGSVIIWFRTLNHIMTSDKIVYLFGKVSPSISLVLSMSFRFVPLFKEQFREISEGQRCIGRDASKGGIFKRAKQYMRELSILITWSLENSIELSDSMRARGYGLPNRSSFSIFRFDKRDGIVLGIIISLSIIVAVGCYFDKNNIIYYPEIIMGDITILAIIVYLSYFVLLLIPIIIDLVEEYKWKSLISTM